MQKDHNESVVRLDHDGKFAEIWTANRRVVNMLKRVGANPMERQIAGQWWRVNCRVGTRGLIFGKRRTGRGFGATRANPAPPS